MTPSPAPRAGRDDCSFCGAPPDSARAVGLRFCDSGHAADYLAHGRLTGARAAELQSSPPAAPRRGVDGVVVVLVAAFLASLTLILIGCWQIAQWVLA